MYEVRIRCRTIEEANKLLRYAEELNLDGYYEDYKGE